MRYIRLYSVVVLSICFSTATSLADFQCESSGQERSKTLTGPHHVVDIDPLPVMLESQFLTAPDPMNTNSHQGFGQDFDLDGETLAVSQLRQMGTGEGLVEIFRMQNGEWARTQVIDFPVQQADYGLFGYSLSLSDDVLAIGAPRRCATQDNCQEGEAYIFKFDPQSDQWTLSKTIGPPVAGSTGFGRHVNLSGDELAVAHNGEEKIHIYRRHEGGTDNWGLVGEANVEGLENGLLFYDSDIRLVGDDLMAQFRLRVSDEQLEPPDLYIFKRPSSGQVWELMQVIDPPCDIQEFDYDGQTLVISIAGHDEEPSDLMFFERGTGGDFELIQDLAPGIPLNGLNLDGSRLLAASNYEAAEDNVGLLLTRSNGEWMPVSRLETQRQGNFSSYGQALLEGRQALVSFRFSDVPETNTGAVLVYELASGFTINPGLNDAWYNPATSGQGFLITVLPEAGIVFLAWFTYDTERPSGDAIALLGEPGHRWLTAQGPFEGDTALLDIVVSEGGIFDTGDPKPQNRFDGTIELVFTDCNSGVLKYNIPSLGRMGEIPIQRIVPDNVARCEALQ